jgi:trans-aconitate methyltransferase
LARLEGIAPDATVLDVGCGTGRVTEALLAFAPRGRVLAIDASTDMVALARTRLGERAQVWREDALDLDLDEPVDAIVSTAALHWVPDHDRLWARLAQALRPGGVLEIQCGGEGNIEGVRKVIERVVGDSARSSSASLRGSSQDLGRRRAGCRRQASPRRGAGWRSARHIRRT